MSAGLSLPPGDSYQGGPSVTARDTHPRRGGGKDGRNGGAVASTADHESQQTPGVRGDEAPGGILF